MARYPLPKKIAGKQELEPVSPGLLFSVIIAGGGL